VESSKAIAHFEDVSLPIPLVILCWLELKSKSPRDIRPGVLNSNWDGRSLRSLTLLEEQRIMATQLDPATVVLQSIGHAPHNTYAELHELTGVSCDNVVASRSWTNVNSTAVSHAATP
jgi:hypothetical protein